ncbi:hypothetical protein J6590_079774 [Homalodisca vitripennis]|nr:hypothetical protein J6590_079774 [Homalodisca vitripennis]
MIRHYEEDGYSGFATEGIIVTIQPEILVSQRTCSAAAGNFRYHNKQNGHSRS